MIKRIIILFAVIGGAIFLVWKFFNPLEGSWIENAKMRVNYVFEGIKKGVSEDVGLQTAICKWWNGTLTINDVNELDAAEEGFREWRAKGGFSTPISNYKIISAERLENVDIVTIIVTVDIDGKKAKLRVPAGLNITWTD
jgi:hypothetical protein